jgi:formylglycine-generating enzyme required for sulfatase activity
MANPYSSGGDAIALRGGSWSDDRRYACVSDRNIEQSDYFGSYVGFRVVVAPV